jgi:beta-lactamase class A
MSAPATASLPANLRDQSVALDSIQLDAVDRLRLRLEQIERDSGARALAVAIYDTATGLSVRYNAERWFHAASTIKLAILLGVYSGIHRGWLLPQSRLHVRNRFMSAVDGQPFRVASDRDANAQVHAATGKMLRVSELARHMIATSSNLATNLLLDLVGLDTVQQSLTEFCIEGVDIRRGVEDERAFERGINNRVTAAGLVDLLHVIADGQAFSRELSDNMLDLLHAQEFRNGIPARLPSAVRVAHKTGEISTVAHDAGVVYPPDRKPYVIAVLTEWSPEGSGRSATIAEVSRTVYEMLAQTAGDTDG